MSEVAGLLRALARMARQAGLDARFTSEAARPWASATYTGTRHRIVLHARDDPARAAWLGALPEAEFAIPGHLVADLVVEDAGADHATIRVLTLVEG